jgi:hypothetical protein
MLRVRNLTCFEFSTYEYNDVGHSDVHNIHPIHLFLEMRVKPTCRSRNVQELSNDAEAYESTDEPCKQPMGPSG